MNGGARRAAEPPSGRSPIGDSLEIDSRAQARPTRLNKLTA
jgi:hypothetical protein